MRVLEAAALTPERVPLGERLVRRADIFVDDRAGFHALAVRHSLRMGFNRERWAHGHPIAFLDIDRAGHLPRWEVVDRALGRWLFSPHRYAPKPLLDEMRATCDGLVVTNLQAHVSMPYLVAARKLDVPVVGYVASWDHTVGKGVVSPHLAATSSRTRRWRASSSATTASIPRRSLSRAGRRRTSTTGAERGTSTRLCSGATTSTLAGRSFSSRGTRPTTRPTRAGSSRGSFGGGRTAVPSERYSLLFRPHPRDNRAAERFAAAAGIDGAAVQEPSYTDLEDLATLLQHADGVVANAGTVLLDAIVNDRPAVCVLFDEGAKPGEHWADRNLAGDHYRRLARSGAFLEARDFDELTAAIDRSLTERDALAAERAEIARELVGTVDGKAGERVVTAIAAALGAS